MSPPGERPGRRPSIAVIVPLWRESEPAALDSLSGDNIPDELILVEVAGDAVTGAALDARTAKIGIGPLPPRRLSAPRGRAAQMNRGARAAGADVLLFLHADTRLPPGALARVREVVAGGRAWGRFDVRLSGGAAVFRAIEWLMNWRSAVTGIATGDQAIFVRRDVFRMLGGFPAIPLMEDIALSTRLKWVERPARLRDRVVASSRRWERDGVARTVVRMWLLRGLYGIGVSPGRLAQWYK
ncbi:glycosyl transferase [Sulfurifustis variabilis]|uniref:Glycosyl transferase n=1 Tax=Sulfurifustis variabilis TaxID=1675686 RepID=A0A1B4V719_9GAMM|nr:TIGR04283 family arsenosugar biosynthesis glycosyltransferase [Sulfurifustis variabilis]BAU49318.1 glycosyl transferase [Sulfurifustis variabilis]